ncbi:uncharacterized protein G2W53_030198 [Senna tora]|uniref:Uncharacterized protein n=1 Tax=Senna tora TaxID=362788 RepID=A0A834WGH9_9FABA|nr:uncharacterized protein G2W53_030198 [Senna tora]
MGMTLHSQYSSPQKDQMSYGNKNA